MYIHQLITLANSKLYLFLNKIQNLKQNRKRNIYKHCHVFEKATCNAKSSTKKYKAAPFCLFLFKLHHKEKIY